MDDDARNVASSLKTGDEAKRAHRRRRFSRTRLPTPPPDPTAEEPGSPDSKDAHFFEYINALQQLHHGGRSDSLFAPAIAAEDAFDHLDKLYKLMEQMLNLKQQNAKLQKRLKDLEHMGWAHTALKDLQSSHHVAFEDIPELDDDSSFAESLLDTMLSKKDTKAKSWARSRLRHSLLRRQRNRSSSLYDRVDLEELQSRRPSGEKPSKVSKWTKVKAAFRWEKASPSVSGAKSQDSGIGGMHPLNCEVARYLRVPSMSDEAGISPADSGAADGSTPGSLSSASSVDDLQRQELRCIHEGLCSDEKHNGVLGDEVPRVAVINARRKDCNREKHRLSARSDDVNIEFSDTEEVEAERAKGSPSREREAINKQSVKKDHREDVPTDIVERYQQVVAEEESKKPKRASKWVRVKKAFLTPYNVHGSHGDKSENDQQASFNSGGKRDHHSYKDDAQKIQDEIQKNYRQLQKKLSLEFQDKLKEWEKLKANPNVTLGGRSESTTEEQRDQAFMKKMEEWQRIKSQPSRPIQMIREENLAPEFKKKLEEWQKIKKYTSRDDSIQVKPKKKLGEWPKWKSVSGQREEQPHAENQPLSDEFLKKLEEWRRMKESKHYDVKEKTPSPRSLRKFPKKEDTKELQWFEKELDKIEREKQRLEQERQKFLQREERLTKLRRTVMGDGNKKDVLVHTPSGFYRFEGISRKFTQKLCEWEEAQGIGPEASTFALLTSNFTPHVTVDLYEANPRASKIIRSKSAESLAVPNFVQPCPSTSHHPSSLSLNDMEELERQCLAISNESSLHSSLEKLHPDDEPEAVIVEVEDVVEETAAPLEERLQEKHFPVYQREMELNVCEEKSLVVPCFQSVDPKSAQFSYFLIEELVKLVKTIEGDERDDEDQIALDAYNDAQSPSEEETSLNFMKLKDKNQMQKQRSDTVFEKIVHLQEIHSQNISDITEEAVGAHFYNLLEAAQDSFSELLQMAEQLLHLLHGRCENKASFQLESSYSDVCAITSELIAKLSELKRILTYFYSASDMTAPRRKIKHGNSEDKIPEKNSEAKPEKVSTKRQRYKKKNYSSKTLESDDSDIDNHSNKVNKKLPEEEVVTIDPQIVEKLVIPTKTNYVNAWEPTPSNETKPVDVFVKTTRKLFVSPANLESTKQQRIEARDPDMESLEDQERGSPEERSLETKTLQRNKSERRIPDESKSRRKDSESRTLKERNLEENKSPEVGRPERKTSDPKRPERKTSEPKLREAKNREGRNREPKNQEAESSESSKPSKCLEPSFQFALATTSDLTQNHNQEPAEKTSKPPLPSPTPQRKASKEISPSIRLMLAKYHQMISGQETASVGGSSGSASPIWRSPVSERRVQAQRERYLEEVRKIGGSEVKKSASMAVLHTERQPYRPLTTPKDKGILRSTSASVIQTNTPPKESASLKLTIPQRPERRSLEERYNRLQKAKEQFLNSPATPTAGPSSAPPVFPDMPKYPPRSRFSQISMASESSCESSYEGVLVKSASAGMINVDEDTYRTIDPAFHKDGYVSLPRSVQKQKEGFLSGKLALANIAAKFRKVRMRKSKDLKKMNTVSALCRQSLVVDINSSQEALSRRESLTVPETCKSSSEDTSPSSSRSGSWIRRSRIFKAL